MISRHLLGIEIDYDIIEMLVWLIIVTNILSFLMSTTIPVLLELELYDHAVSWHIFQFWVPKLWLSCHTSPILHGPWTDPSARTSRCPCGPAWWPCRRLKTSWRRWRGPRPWWSDLCFHSPDGCHLKETKINKWQRTYTYKMELTLLMLRRN